MPTNPVPTWEDTEELDDDIPSWDDSDPISDRAPGAEQSDRDFEQFAALQGAMGSEGQRVQPKFDIARVAEPEPFSFNRAQEISNTPMVNLRRPTPEYMAEHPIAGPFEKRLLEGIEGMTTPGNLAMIPAFAVPYLGPAFAGVLGAKTVGSGLGEVFSGPAKDAFVGEPEAVGAGLADTALGAGMLLPIHQAGKTAVFEASPVGRLTRELDAAEFTPRQERGGAPTQPVPQVVAPNQAGARPFFDRGSEARGLDRPSTAPTVESVRAQRAAESAAEAQGQEIGQAVANDLGVKWDGPLRDKWTFTIKDGPAKDAQIGVPAKSSPEFIKQRILEKQAEFSPEPPAGERLVELVKQNGTSEVVSFSDKFYDYPNKGDAPSIARPNAQGEWSHGMAPKGSTIRELTTTERTASEAPKETQAPVLAEAAKADPIETWFNEAIESTGLDPAKSMEGVLGAPVWLARGTANAALRVAKGAYTTTRDVTKAVAAAIDHMRQANPKGFNEAEARAWLEERLGGLEKTERQGTAASPDPSLSSGEVKTRKLAERGAVAESIPEPVREQIKSDPQSQYPVQSLRKVESAVRSMSEPELNAVGRESEMYTAAKLEQAQRQFDSGNNARGYEIFTELETELTRLGQVINQAKLLNALKPENVVRVINEKLKEAGKDPLTPDQAAKVEALSAARIKAQRDLDLATDKWMKDPTEANAAAAEQALLDSNSTALAEQQFVNRFQDRSLPQLLKSILQGNLLTPISEVANLVGNVSFLPFRAATRTGATLLDVLDSTIRGRPRKVSVAPASGTIEASKGLVRGLKQIPEILYRGTGDVIKGESRQGMHPMEAWVKQFAKNPEMPTVSGKVPFIDRIKLAIEGTLAVPAELMLRGLGAGDAPFREAGRARVISEQARLKGVPKDQIKMAQSFPELFFDRETLRQIEQDTRGAIFQRESKTLGHLQSWLKGHHDWMDFAIATVAPYKLTPWNIVGEILSYNPLVAMGRTALEAKRGNVRAAEMNSAKVVVGSTLSYAGWWLYENGLLSPSMDSKDEAQKARILAGEVIPPNHINLSGLKRKMEGGDPSFKAGDETVDIFRAGGLAGSIFYMTANIGRDMEKSPEPDAAMLSILKNSTLEQARFGLNQSFLKGVASLLDAVRNGETDSFIQSYASTILSIPLPNTLSALSRSTRDYKPDILGDTFKKQMENVVRTRLGVVGLDDYLPLKRGLWGEPLPETPKDGNALLYHFFDITKNKQVTSDPVPLELYRLWRKTSDTTAIPSLPAKTLTENKITYVLTPEQQSRQAELIGQWRRQIVDKLVVNPNWHKLTDEQKVKVLDTAYQKGHEAGKSLFLKEWRGKLTPKNQKAGFTVQPATAP